MPSFSPPYFLAFRSCDPASPRHQTRWAGRPSMKSPRMKAETGFTLIELLVVVVVIAVLATLALPTFLAQPERARDAEAQANAHNALSEVESCFVEWGDYTRCRTPEVLENTTLPASGPAAVTIEGTRSTYRIEANSRSADGAQSFTIAKAEGGDLTRDCAMPGQGACSAEVDAGGDRW